MGDAQMKTQLIVEAAVKAAVRDRDAVWCKAILGELSVNDVNRVLGCFIAIRPKGPNTGIALAAIEAAKEKL
jgi:hypothetical protein